MKLDKDLIDDKELFMEQAPDIKEAIMNRVRMGVSVIVEDWWKYLRVDKAREEMVRRQLNR